MSLIYTLQQNSCEVSNAGYYLFNKVKFRYIYIIYIYYLYKHIYVCIYNFIMKANITDLR